MNGLRKLRKQKNLTLEEVAIKMGCSQSCICKYENGKRTPDINIIQKYADALNTTPKKIFDAWLEEV